MTAYAIISHGEDALGAVKLNYSAANGVNTPPYVGHGWCTGGATLKYKNCLASATGVLVDGTFNNGKNAGANYFDDIVVASSKPQVLTAAVATSNVYCWGINDSRQLGDNTVVDHASPAVVTGGVTFVTLSSNTNASHTCGLTSTGAAYCWGSNTNGQLGDGTLINNGTPTPVLGGLFFSSITTGSAATCGITTAGAAYCWGSGAGGALGDGTTTQRLTPFPVAGGLTFQSIAIGQIHACGIATNGSLYCWGNNLAGQLGDGTTTAHMTPAIVPDGRTYSSVTVSPNALRANTCGITTGGAAYCWGNNAYGQLGIGFAGPIVTSPTAVTGGYRFRSINVGPGYRTQVCGTTISGAAYCWGYNASGQMGDGTTTGQPSPTPVSGGLKFASRISTGYDHSCASTQSGALYCWGGNSVGQLGDGTTTDSLVPVAVTGGFSFRSVEAGNSHSCALLSSPYIYVADCNNSRVQKFDMNGTFISKFGTAGVGDGQFNCPRGVWTDIDNNVWVVEYNNARIQQFDSNGNFIKKFNVTSGINLTGVTGDNTGILWILDRWNHLIKYTTDGVYIGAYAGWGVAVGEFGTMVNSIALDSLGNVWGADIWSSRIQKFDNAGSYVSNFATVGGSFFCGLSIDNNDNFYASDCSSANLRKYNSAGVFQMNIGTPFGGVPGDGQYSNVAGTAIDSGGNVWVVDYIAHRVQKFNSVGAFQLKFGSAPGVAGSGDGQFDTPYGITISR